MNTLNLKRIKQKKYFTLKIVKCFVALLAFSAVCLSNAQTNKLHSAETNKKDTIAKCYFGGYAGYNLNMQFGNFTEIRTDCPTCVGADYGDYGFTAGSGFAIGGIFEYPLFKKVNGEKVKPANNIAPKSIGVRVGYSNLSANYRIEAKIGNALNQSGNVVDGISAHILETDISLINFSPYFALNLTGNLVGTIGLNLGYLLTNGFNQREELVSPAGALYLEEKARVRNKFDNRTVPDVNALQIGFGVGLGYHLPMGKHSFIVPEISYNFNFTDVASHLDWKTSALQIGVALKVPILEYPHSEKISPQIFFQRDTIIAYKHGITKPEIVLTSSRREPIGKDTLVVEKFTKYMPQKAELAANLSYYAMDRGQRKDAAYITIEEFETTESFPLLPIVYFNDGNGDLAQTRMRLLTSGTVNAFDENKLKSDIFEVYYNTLNVIARRLKNSRATITIVGFSSGSGLDAQDRTIWQKRANSVRDYFVNVWGISANRVRIEQGTPERRDVGSASYADVVEENQKVDIRSSDFATLMPVTLSDIEKISSPPQIIFEMDGHSETGLTNYSFVLSQAGTKLREYTEPLHSKQFDLKKTWYISDAPLPMLEKPVTALLTVKDKANHEETRKLDIAIHQKTISTKRALVENDMRIERHSLVLFDIDRATLTPKHQRILDEIRKSSIQPNSELSIFGYADRTGSEQHNVDLANRRCISVNNHINPNRRINAVLEAIGSRELIYNNDLPEARAFSRTVKIEIRTPIK